MKEYGLVKSWTKLSIDNCVGFIFDPTSLQLIFSSWLQCGVISCCIINFHSFLVLACAYDASTTLFNIVLLIS